MYVNIYVKMINLKEKKKKLKLVTEQSNILKSV